MGADFSGYATKAGLKCSDGRTITPEAFQHMDGVKVPLVWKHMHDSPENVLGHAVLEARQDGVYAYGYFNDSEWGKKAKALVEHGDIKALSIYANQLKHKASSVVHGMIRELSLAIAGANEGAFIDNVQVQHSDDYLETLEDQAFISTGLPLEHEDGPGSGEGEDKTVQEVYDGFTDEQKDVVHFMVGEALEQAGVQHSDDGTPKTVKQIFDSFSEDQKKLVHYVVGESLKAAALAHSDTEGNGHMTTRNVFEKGSGPKAERQTLTHDQVKTILTDAGSRFGGSIKESVLAHAVEYGIENIDFLFPDAKTITGSPEFVKRRTEWVAEFLGGVHKTPFSRIKTMTADITHDEARAKGYIRGNMKKEEWFALAKRVTTPTTIYKKQKLDRDDIIDITDLDVVAWLKAEMRIMLDEELARAALIGDGREPDDEDKISEDNIRPIAYESEFYVHKITVPTNVSGDAAVEAMLRGRTRYRGSGNPTAFMTEDYLTDLLLSKDKLGRRLYRNQGELEAEMRVRKIVTVDVMENAKVDGDDLLCIQLNLDDYNLGADKGGAVSMFDDFDIDVNQYKYLIETRCSGALTRFKSAIIVVRSGGGTLVSPTDPTFVPATGVVTIPNVAGVIYTDRDTEEVLAAGAQPALDPGESLDIVASPATGYYFPHNIDADWLFTRPVA